MKNKLEVAINNLADGDNNALAVIYDLTYRGVFSFVLPIVKDYALAEDVLQNTYIQIYENITSYKNDTNPLNWILTIAKNLALNEYNKNKKIVNFDYDDEAYQSSGLCSLDSNLDTPTISLANEILSQDEFAIVIMYVVGEYKHREIAEILNMPLGTVTWKYKVALEKLKEEIERREVLANERLREIA